MLTKKCFFRIRQLNLISGYNLIKVLMLMIMMAWSPLSASAENERPSFNQSRYKEDYRFLKTPTKRADFFDPIKYIPLNKSESLYLTLGGETRQHFESIKNNNWGKGTQDDNGYYLQRYLDSR